MKNGWTRCTKELLCPTCKHHDWCLIASDGSACLCQRIESKKRVGDAGWLHKITDQLPVQAKVDRWEPPASDLTEMARIHAERITKIQLADLGKSLGLSADSLRKVGTGWSDHYQCWTFPMKDATGKVVGIRLRRPDNGRKFSVKGGREGLFIPSTITPGGLIIVEGATDVAACLDMGFVNVVGRPSCSGGTRLLAMVCRKWKPVQLVIFPDNDEPGIKGANRLVVSLLSLRIPITVVGLPQGIKDMREWRRSGADKKCVVAEILAKQP